MVEHTINGCRCLAVATCGLTRCPIGPPLRPSRHRGCKMTVDGGLPFLSWGISGLLLDLFCLAFLPCLEISLTLSCSFLHTLGSTLSSRPALHRSPDPVSRSRLLPMASSPHCRSVYDSRPRPLHSKSSLLRAPFLSTKFIWNFYLNRRADLQSSGLQRWEKHFQMRVQPMIKFHQLKWR